MKCRKSLIRIALRKKRCVASGQNEPSSLALAVATRLPPPVTLEISSLRNVDGDIIDYFVDEDCRAINRMIKDLALPDGVVIALIVREEQIIPPQGRSILRRGDHVIVVLRPQVRSLVDRVFAHRKHSTDDLPAELEFPLRGSIRASELEQFYGLVLDSDKDASLSEMIRKRLNKPNTKPGDVVHFEEVSLHVREVSSDGNVEFVGMVLHPRSDTNESPETNESVVQQDTSNPAPIASE